MLGYYGHWPRINQAIYTALQSISLEEMSQPYPPHPMRFHALHPMMPASTGRLIQIEWPNGPTGTAP